jgi:hypothetical protein
MLAVLLYWAPGSPYSSSGPKNSCCHQTLFSQDCSSCYGFRKPTPWHKQIPGFPLPCGHWKIQACWLCSPTHLQLATQCQEPAAAICPSESKVHILLFCWLREAFLPTEHRGSVLTTKPSGRRAPTALSKSGNPTLPLSSNLPLCGCQETCFPKAQKGPVLPTIPGHGESPSSFFKE